MASKYTPNYNLCQWEPEDKVLRADFNADNAKIDAALAGMASSVGGKASASALESLKATVSQQGAALEKKGNCQIYHTTYIGDGTYGEANARSLTFPKKPVMVFIWVNQARTFLVQGTETGWSQSGNSLPSPITISWSGNSVRWFSAANASAHMNSVKMTYHVVAFLQAD